MTQSTFSDRGLIRNKVGLALRERIVRAFKANEPFLVLVFLPLLPAFSGDILESSSALLRIQVNYQSKSIAKGKLSLLELLKSDGIVDPAKYIKFLSLRTHSVTPRG